MYIRTKSESQDYYIMINYYNKANCIYMYLRN